MNKCGFCDEWTIHCYECDTDNCETPSCPGNTGHNWLECKGEEQAA